MARRRMPSTPFQRGVTLLELVVAMSASSMLLLSMGSMIVLTARAIPSGEDRGSIAANASHALQRMCDDLHDAKSVVINPQELKLLVPDINGDGIPDQVVYWLDTGVLYSGSSRAAPNPNALLDGVVSFVMAPDAGTGVLRAVRLSLLLDSIGTVETTVETVARPTRP